MKPPKQPEQGQTTSADQSEVNYAHAMVVLVAIPILKRVNSVKGDVHANLRQQQL